MTDALEPVYLEYQQLVDMIEKGVTLVTGNLRLSQALRKSFELTQLQHGRNVWETPDILPWDAWLKRNFKTPQISSRQLLTDTQERLLWERVISETPQGQGLLQVPAAARHCAAAWRLMHEWQLSEADIQAWHNGDSKVFMAWRAIFQSHCETAGWVTRSQLATLLSESCQARQMPSDSHIILSGFDELTPQQLSLFASMKQASCRLQWIEKRPLKGRSVTLKLDQTRDEIEAAARWSRRLIESDANVRVGIIVPELATHRTALQAIFDRVLIPASLATTAQDIQRPYNITMGLPLTRSALVDTALLILDNGSDDWDLEAFSVVLNSPFLAGWQQEQTARALLERKIREYSRQKLPLSLIIHCAAETERPYYCPVLLDMLEKMRGLFAGLPTRAQARDWTGHFSAILAAMGLTQGRGLSSEEFQTLQAWNDCLRDLACIDHVSASINYRQAYRYLSQLTRERVFQPQSGDAAIQVMGMMEAIGLEFDHLWVMGLHDTVWPPPPRPNQFLPVGLQREKMLPHSSARREAVVAAHITRRFLGSAPQVIFSYPASQGDEQLRLSSLLSDLPGITLESLSIWNQALWDERIYAAAELEIWRDDAVELTDADSVRGGSQIFKLQAICPFRAFAELRLGARGPEEASTGLAASERGTLVHQVMEFFWQRVTDQKQLLNMDAQLKKNLVADCVRRAVSKLEQRRGGMISERYQQLEQARLEKLVHEWLRIEEQREAFSVIQVEQKVALDIQGMTINLKVDRIDQLEDGGRVVIDYKTGQVNPSQWFGARPEEPQLPLYSMCLQESLVGLVFAQLKPGESAFKGIAQSRSLLPGVRSCEQMPQARQVGDWNALLADWRETIETLARDFRQGLAQVDPLRYPGSCQYCSLGQLCRVSERDDLMIRDDGDI